MESADSNVGSAAEIPQSATTELITIGSEDGQEPPSVQEVTLESLTGWQAGRLEEDTGEEVKMKSTFTRFRRKTQRLKEQSSNGWLLLHGTRGCVKQLPSKEKEQTSPSVFLICPFSSIEGLISYVYVYNIKSDFMLIIVLWLKLTRQNRP